jgi:uncharacterized damage-inducible protein DinB
MLVAQYQAFARYNTWMNGRLYELCTRIPDADRRRDLGAFFKSVHGTLNHLLLADRAWLGRFTDDRRVGESRAGDGRVIEVRSLDQHLYEDFDELRRERVRTDADLERWVAGLTPERLAAPLKYRTSAGAECEHVLWWAVTHLFNHQTHHRGQLTTLLSQLGYDPGVTDMAVLLRG